MFHLPRLQKMSQQQQLRNVYSTTNKFVRENQRLFVGLAIAASPLLLTTALPVVGFLPAGVAKGSLAASWMKLYGGYIAKGSLLSVFQSVGAAGVSTATIVGTSVSGGAIACSDYSTGVARSTFGYIYSYFPSRDAFLRVLPFRKADTTTTD